MFLSICMVISLFLNLNLESWRIGHPIWDKDFCRKYQVIRDGGSIIEGKREVETILYMQNQAATRAPLVTSWIQLWIGECKKIRKDTVLPLLFD